jgi:hypothetical protein
VKVIGVIVPLLAGAVKLVNAHDNKVRAEYEKQKTEQQDQTELKANVKTIMVQNDSLFKVVHRLEWGQQDIRSDMTRVTTVVKKLSDDFVNHLSKDPTITKQDIIDVMGGLQFEISQPAGNVNKSMDKSAEPGFKIKIIPIKK